MKPKIPQKMRIGVLDRDGHKCLWCGRSAPDVTLDVDHVVAEVWGGKSTEDNLGTLCSHCNRAKGADYYGSYLLTTILKVVDIDRGIVRTSARKTFEDGCSHKLILSFFRDNGQVYQEEKIVHEYFIPEMYITAKGHDGKIKIDEIHKKAKLEFKDKLRDYLFENKCFLEESGNKLIFRERK